jgi:hypothetical protein
MPTRPLLRLAELVLVAALIAAIFFAWREDRRDRIQLAAQLTAAQQALNAADARQHDRDAQLQQSLAAIAAQKRLVQTPSQILAGLPHELPLPTPFVLEQKPLPDNPAAKPGGNSQSERGAAGLATQVVIPPEDLKPLYDFTLDCKACQAKLAAAQGDLADERTKTAALAKERDAALRAAKGGSLLRRIGRAAKWFAIGAAAGALAAKSARN